MRFVVLPVCVLFSCVLAAFFSLRLHLRGAGDWGWGACVHGLWVLWLMWGFVGFHVTLAALGLQPRLKGASPCRFL